MELEKMTREEFNNITVGQMIRFTDNRDITKTLRERAAIIIEEKNAIGVEGAKVFSIGMLDASGNIEEDRHYNLFIEDSIYFYLINSKTTESLKSSWENLL